MHTAYFAGLFDGEGYVGVKYRDWDNESFLEVTIVNNHHDVLEMCRQRFGGRLMNPRPSKTAWTWRIQGIKARGFLRAVYPYTVIKKPQIETALSFPFGIRGKRVTEDIHQRRRSIHYRLMEQKHEVHGGQLSYLLPVRQELEHRADVQEAVALYQQGKTVTEVGEHFGIMPATIAYWMRCLGINRPRTEAGKIAGRKRPDSVWKNPNAIRAKEMYQQGTSIAEIARNLEAKPATVNAWLRKMGVTRSLSESQRLRRERERTS